MSVASLPTDNLYKFIALSGVAIIAATIVAFLNFASDVSIKLAEAKGAVGSVEFELRLIERLGIDLVSPIADPYLQQRAIRFLDLNAKATQQAAIIDELRTRLDFAWKSFIIAMIWGHVLAAWGFGMWYRRLQRHQDIDLSTRFPDRRSTRPPKDQQ